MPAYPGAKPGRRIGAELIADVPAPGWRGPDLAASALETHAAIGVPADLLDPLAILEAGTNRLVPGALVEAFRGAVELS